MAATVLINNLVANATTLFEQTGAVSTIAKHTGVDLAMLYATFVTFMHDAGVAQRAVYDTIDYSSLNFAEQLWFRWYSSWSNPIIATGVMAFVMHEVIYFGRCVPWMIIDNTPYFNKWKLQETKIPSAKQQWECTKYVLKTHFTVELPQIYLFHPMATSVGMKTWELPFPSIPSILGQLALFFVMEDAWHYMSHRILHHKRLYKHIHKLHHEFSAPFGLAAEYAHPIEIMVLGAGTVGGPLLWCWASGGNMHLVTMYIWITLRLFQAVDAHSGYDFPWSLHHVFPLWAGADHHDYHHQAFQDCYSTSFRWLDYMFGTDRKYHAFRDKQKAAKALQAEAASSKKAL